MRGCCGGEQRAAIGGSARNNGLTDPAVAGFSNDPKDAAYNEKEQIAILLNGDGEHGNTNNWMKNDGWLYADGGAANGNGGDITAEYIGLHTVVGAGGYNPNGGPGMNELAVPVLYR